MKKRLLSVSVGVLFILLPALMYGWTLKPIDRPPMQKFAPEKNVMVRLKASLDVGHSPGYIDRIELRVYKDGEYIFSVLSDVQEDTDNLKLGEHSLGLAVVFPANSPHTYTIYPNGVASNGALLEAVYHYHWFYSGDGTRFVSPTLDVFTDEYETSHIVIDQNSPNLIFLNIGGQIIPPTSTIDHFRPR